MKTGRRHSRRKRRKISRSSSSATSAAPQPHPSSQGTTSSIHLINTRSAADPSSWSSSGAFVDLCGVAIPPDVMRHVFSFLECTPHLLFTAGLVNWQFLRYLLCNWHAPLRIPAIGRNPIPDVVLSNLRSIVLDLVRMPANRQRKDGTKTLKWHLCRIPWERVRKLLFRAKKETEDEDEDDWCGARLAQRDRTNVNRVMGLFVSFARQNRARFALVEEVEFVGRREIEGLCLKKRRNTKQQEEETDDDGLHFTLSDLSPNCRRAVGVLDLFGHCSCIRNTLEAVVTEQISIPESLVDSGTDLSTFFPRLRHFEQRTTDCLSLRLGTTEAQFIGSSLLPRLESLSLGKFPPKMKKEYDNDQSGRLEKFGTWMYGQSMSKFDLCEMEFMPEFAFLLSGGTYPLLTKLVLVDANPAHDYHENPRDKNDRRGAVGCFGTSLEIPNCRKLILRGFELGKQLSVALTASRSLEMVVLTNGQISWYNAHDAEIFEPGIEDKLVRLIQEGRSSSSSEEEGGRLKQIFVQIGAGDFCDHSFFLTLDPKYDWRRDSHFFGGSTQKGRGAVVHEASLTWDDDDPDCPSAIRALLRLYPDSESISDLKCLMFRTGGLRGAYYVTDQMIARGIPASRIRIKKRRRKYVLSCGEFIRFDLCQWEREYPLSEYRNVPTRNYVGKKRNHERKEWEGRRFRKLYNSESDYDDDGDGDECVVQ